MPYMYARGPCQTFPFHPRGLRPSLSMPYMYSLYVCLICMPYMYARGPCQTFPFRPRGLRPSLLALLLSPAPENTF